MRGEAACSLASSAVRGIRRRRRRPARHRRRPGAPRLVVATGGLPVKIGASDFGFRLAQQFGHRVIALRARPGPLTFDAAGLGTLRAAGGHLAAGRHRNRRWQGTRPPSSRTCSSPTAASGPAVLQASNYWREGEPLRLDLGPGLDLAAELLAAKRALASSAPNWPNGCRAGSPRPWLAARPGSRRWPRCATPSCAKLAASLEWADHARRQRGLPQGRGHAGRGGHPRAQPADPGEPPAAGPAFSSARWSTSPAGSAVTTSSGPGPARPPAPGPGRRSPVCSAPVPTYNRRSLLANPRRDCAAERRQELRPSGFAPSSNTERNSTLTVHDDDPRQGKRAVRRRHCAASSAPSKTGLLTELRAREFYEKPTAERKRKKVAGRQAPLQRVRSMQPPKAYHLSRPSDTVPITEARSLCGLCRFWRRA